MSHVASYVCRKNIFYNQTSLKGFSAFSTISLAFSIALVIPALLKPSLRLISQNWSVTLTVVFEEEKEGDSNGIRTQHYLVRKRTYWVNGRVFVYELSG